MPLMSVIYAISKPWLVNSWISHCCYVNIFIFLVIRTAVMTEKKVQKKLSRSFSEAAYSYLELDKF